MRCLHWLQQLDFVASEKKYSLTQAGQSERRSAIRGVHMSQALLTQSPSNGEDMPNMADDVAGQALFDHIQSATLGSSHNVIVDLLPDLLVEELRDPHGDDPSGLPATLLAAFAVVLARFT